jgi:hypothetical protein
LKKSDVLKFTPGTAEYVVMHGRYQISRGRNPSESFLWISNPRFAFSVALKRALFPTSDSSEYLKDTTLAHEYKCSTCGKESCKLWREYNTFASVSELYCVDCAARNQKKDISILSTGGMRMTKHGWTDQIGWLVPAVPTQDGDTYWGYTSVPQSGCDWWASLPNR